MPETSRIQMSSGEQIHCVNDLCAQTYNLDAERQ